MSIDRDALIELLSDFDPDTVTPEMTADRILALVRPVEGITLTPEEADFIASELNGMLQQYDGSDGSDEQQANFYRRALAARLEASS